MCSAQTLSFVAVRLTLSEAQKERLQPQPVTARRLGVSTTTTTAGKAQTPLGVAPATIRQLQDLIFIAAQQFQGYVFDVNNEEVLFLLNQVLSMHTRALALRVMSP